MYPPRLQTRRSSQISYAQRLDRVLDHVAEHLDGDLDLGSLAKVAGFSPFHFHRLFQGSTGETVAEHVRRVRLERAASLMLAAPGRSMTDIALACGFPALSDLSRAFKARHGIAPSKWDRRSPLPASKDAAGRISDAELAAKSKGLRVRTLALPPSLFVFTRVWNAYDSAKLVAAYHQMRTWLGAALPIFAGMSIDDPSVTPREKYRYDLGVVFPFAHTGVVAEIARLRGAPVSPPPPPHVARASGFSVRRFPALSLATVHVTGDIGAVGVSWHWLYRTYLPQQARLPGHHPAMELFVRLPEEIGWTQFDLLACVPLA